MIKRIVTFGGLLCLQFAGLLAAAADNKPAGPPPAIVSVAPVASGNVRPQADFIATVFYQEVSDVAAEVAGLVETVHFEEGQPVASGQVLVALRSDMLAKRLKATRSSHEQALADLEIERINLARKQTLFGRNAISEQQFDENRFRVKALEKRAGAMQAEVERLLLELDKTRIRAPFAGIIIGRRVDRGEWIAAGQTAAVLAKNDVVDIVVELPERYIPFVKKGMPAPIQADHARLSGKVFAIVPRGDIATRTFPVKIRTPNSAGLIEGMSAAVTLPTGEPRSALILPRDAVITVLGRTAVFVVNDGKAHMIPVRVIGYEGFQAGVQAAVLKPQSLVVVKGNERLRDGQAVSIVKTLPPAEGTSDLKKRNGVAPEKSTQ